MTLKLVHDEQPNFVEALEDTARLARDGKLTALGIVYIMDDKIYTDFVKADGTTLTELLGATSFLQDSIKRRLTE